MYIIIAPSRLVRDFPETMVHRERKEKPEGRGCQEMKE